MRNILTEYADYLPLTLRQIFYRLLGADGFPKTEDEDKILGEYLNRARRSGRIPQEATATTVSLSWVQITGLFPRT